RTYANGSKRKADTNEPGNDTDFLQYGMPPEKQPVVVFERKRPCHRIEEVLRHPEIQCAAARNPRKHDPGGNQSEQIGEDETA
ncbi:MAG TPA: hypothetical protein VI140_00450, partial [Oxalicibacterium sp.]